MNYKAIQAFFDLHPKFKNRDFYIAGESYAGIFIPMMAVKFLTDSNLKEKLKVY